MGNRRLTVAGMLWVVAVVGCWLAALRSASVVWTSLTATLTLAALLTAPLGATLSRGRDRAFWLGFALFGWVYLLMVNWDWVGGQFGHDLTGWLSDWAEQAVPTVPGLAVPPSVRMTMRTATAMQPVDVAAVHQRAIQVGNLVQIGRMALSLLFALAGGLIAHVLAVWTAEPVRDEPPR